MTRNEKYTYILKSELKPALGCTEPVAIALAAATASKILGKRPERIIVECSGNIVKNVKGVTVPNSNGMKGIEAAAILGALGGDPNKKLEVLNSVNDDVRRETAELVKTDYASVVLMDGIAGLYINVKVEKGDESAEAALIECHDEIARIKKNGTLIKDKSASGKTDDELDKLRSELNVKDIIDYANTVSLSDVEETLLRQIDFNTRISNEGLNGNYGVNVGKTLQKHYNWDDVRIRARAKAAAGSDARMSGCALPVVINSGSGNQGLTVSMPVIEYGESMGVGKEKILRALCLSNLVAIHQKKYIGPLSAYCGAVSAAAGAAAGIAYLRGGSDKQIADSISNTLAMVGGIVCDGAKASCAAKISSSLEAAVLAMELSMEEGAHFESGDGLVTSNIESTIKAFGKVGKEGMRETDIEILHLMLENQ